MALGGSRARLVRKLLVEALVLSAIGTAVGVLRVGGRPARAAPARARIRCRGSIRSGSMAGCSWWRPCRRRSLGPALRPGPGDPVHAAATCWRCSATADAARPIILAAPRPQPAGGRADGDGARAARGIGPARAQLRAADVGRPRVLARDALTFRVALPPATYPKSPEVVRFTRQLVDRLARIPGSRSGRRDHRAAGAQGPSGTAFEFEGHPVEAGTAATADSVLDRHPGLLRGAADCAAPRVVTSIPATCATVHARRRQQGGGRPVLAGAGCDRKETSTCRSGPDRTSVVHGQGHRRGCPAGGLREPPQALIYFPINPSGDRAPRAFSYVIRGPRAHGAGRRGSPGGLGD